MEPITKRDLQAILVGATLSALTLTFARTGSVETHSPAPMPNPTPVAVKTTPTWDIPVVHNDQVERWIEFLAGPNREHTKLWLERGGRYEPMIRAKLRARGLPEDLLYLAFIESGYSPRATSHARAVGIWQFMESTARGLGLRINSYLDERRDPIRSTDAALDYLEHLYNRFGSWYLAAAAYNGGENRIMRLLRTYANGAIGEDSLFWTIAPYLPRETRNYVPLLLAAGHIAKNPARYGFTDLKHHDPLDFETVIVPPSTSFQQIALAIGTDEESVADLNPHLVKRITPPSAPWPVRIPPGNARFFAHGFPKLTEDPRMVVAQAGPPSYNHLALRVGAPAIESSLTLRDATIHSRSSDDGDIAFHSLR